MDLAFLSGRMWWVTDFTDLTLEIWYLFILYQPASLNSTWAHLRSTGFLDQPRPGSTWSWLDQPSAPAVPAPRGLDSDIARFMRRVEGGGDA